MQSKIQKYGITTSAGADVLSHRVKASKKEKKKKIIHNIKLKFISEVFAEMSLNCRFLAFLQAQKCFELMHRFLQEFLNSICKYD